MLISILACSLGFHAITFERSTFIRKSSLLKSSQCGTEPVGIAFWQPCCAENVVTDRQRNNAYAHFPQR